MRSFLAATLFVSFALATSPACKKSEPKAGAGKAAESGGGAPAAAAPAALAWKPVPALGIQIQVPADTEIMDTSADGPAASLSSTGFNADLAAVTPAFPETYEAAIAEVQKDGNPFQKFTVQEKLAGGWHLEYELKSMMDNSPLYGTNVRVTVGGKQIDCGRNDRDAALVARTAKACLSIKAQ